MNEHEWQKLIVQLLQELIALDKQILLDLQTVLAIIAPKKAVSATLTLKANP